MKNSVIFIIALFVSIRLLESFEQLDVRFYQSQQQPALIYVVSFVIVVEYPRDFFDSGRFVEGIFVREFFGEEQHLEIIRGQRGQYLGQVIGFFHDVDVKVRFLVIVIRPQFLIEGNNVEFPVFVDELNRIQRNFGRFVQRLNVFADVFPFFLEFCQ